MKKISRIWIFAVLFIMLSTFLLFSGKDTALRYWLGNVSFGGSSALSLESTFEDVWKAVAYLSVIPLIQFLLNRLEGFIHILAWFPLGFGITGMIIAELCYCDGSISGYILGLLLCCMSFLLALQVSMEILIETLILFILKKRKVSFMKHERYSCNNNL